MKQAHLGTIAAALACLALGTVTSPSALAAAGPATGRDRLSLGTRPDPSYSAADRRAAIAEANRQRAATARELRLGGRESLVVKDVLRDVSGAEHVRYDRVYAGLPVVGGDLVVHEEPDGAVGTVDRASRARIVLPDTTAEVSPQRAAALAAERNRLDVGRAAPRKVVFAGEDAAVLAWETTVTGREEDGTPVENLVYIDARTGAELGVRPLVHDVDGTGASLYSGTVSLQTTLSGSTYQLYDGTRGGHRTYDANGSTSETTRGTLFTDADNAWGNGTTSSRQSAAVDAAYGAAETWDFYKSHFGRNGIRDDGVAAYSKVHYGTSYENAFWYDGCFCMTYGDGGTTLKPLTSLDVAGHEMSHGVTSATAGLAYSGDAGGLNEATSDVFGTMVEFEAANAADPGDYYIGEKIMRDGTYLRRMDNPAADGASVNCWTSATGTLDPHYSSGVGNHLFYLLAEGSGTKTIGGRTHTGTTCDGSTVTGIGRDAAAAIWYRGLTAYWTSTSTYPSAANGMVKAARDLYGAGSAQCAATVAAWQAVGVATTEPCTATTPPPSSGNLLVNPGFEAGATGWSASSRVITSSTSAAPRTGSYYAWLDGYGTSHTDTLSQTVTIPAAASATLAFHLRVSSRETTTTTAYDTLRVQVVNGTTTTTLATYSNLNKGTGYVARSVNLSAYTGRTVTVKFVGVEDSAAATSFYIDDTSLTTG